MTAVRRVKFTARHVGEATDLAARRLSACEKGRPATCEIVDCADPDWRGKRFSLEEIERGLQHENWPEGTTFQCRARLYRIERRRIIAAGDDNARS